MPWTAITTSALPLARIYSVHPVCYHLPVHRHITSLVTQCISTNSGPACTRARATLCCIRTYSLDSVAEVVTTPASATGSNVVGIIGCEACLSVPNVEMKVQWSFSFSQLSSHIHPFSQYRPARQDRHAAHPQSIQMLPQCPMFHFALRPLSGHTTSLYITLAIQKMPAGLPKPVCAQSSLSWSTPPKCEPADVGSHFLTKHHCCCDVHNWRDGLQPVHGAGGALIVGNTNYHAI